MRFFQNAVIVDVETTGLNPESDKVIEIGVMRVAFQDEKAHILSMYSALEDPGFSLPDEIVKLTGITDQILAGQKIDWNRVQEYFDPETLIIAHNMDFDRGFLQNQTPLQLNGMQWACSVRHVDWDEKGFRSRALNYLAADHGFVNPFAHRALFDCATTYRLIAPHFADLSRRCQEKEVRVFAKDAPFEKKDILRNRKYSWDTVRRVWSKCLSESKLEEERKFLGEHVYGGSSRHVEEAL